MPEWDFWKRRYSEETVLKRALKHAGRDLALGGALEVLYFNEQATDEAIAALLKIDESVVKLRLRPLALQLIARERAKNTQTQALEPASSQEVHPEKSGQGEPVTTTVTELVPSSLDDLEAEAVQIVLKAHTGITLAARLKKWIIAIFKTVAPLAVLCLTIPESIWVFVHIYREPDDILLILTGIFAVLVDVGYLYLTVLLELNKEAMFRRRRAGLAVESHEERAVRVQSVLWWLVAAMDTFAQGVFLYGAIAGSTFFDQRLAMVLAGVRVFSLFLTMFVVSFAGTELLTDVDDAANEQVERAEKVKQVMTALGDARKKQQRARIELEQMIEEQKFRQQGEEFLREMYADARAAAKRQRGRKGMGEDGEKRID